MSLDVLNPVSLKKLKGIGGFTYVDESNMDNQNFWKSRLVIKNDIINGVWEQLTPGGFNVDNRAVAVYNNSMYFLHDGGSTTAITKYNFATEQYTPFTLSGDTLPDDINYGYCYNDNNLWIYGGNGSAATYFSDKFYHIDMLSGVVTKLPSPDNNTTYGKHKNRRNLQCVYYDGIIYVIGGAYDRDPTWEDVKSTNAMLRYNVLTGSWMTRVDLDVTRQEHSSYVINGIIYNVGGTYGTSVYRYPRSNVESYNISTGQIKSGSTDPRDYPIPIGDHSWVQYRNKAYVMGGETTGDALVYDVRRYDPVTNIWTDMPRPPISFSWGEAAEYNDSFYIHGNNSFWRFQSIEQSDFAVERIY